MEVKTDPVEVAVDFVNTWDPAAREPEALGDRASLERFLLDHGFEGEVTEADVAAARSLRARLREAFEAAGDAEAVAKLNDLMRTLGGPPQLVRGTEGWQRRYFARVPHPVARLAATAAAGLLEAIETLGWSRLGVCTGDPCEFVYVDRSRNRSRRFCSQQCADRVNQARSRRRRSGESR